MNAGFFGVGENLTAVPVANLVPELGLAFPIEGLLVAGVFTAAAVALAAVADLVRVRRERRGGAVRAPRVALVGAR